jgi:hypothetical protein
VLRNHHAHHGIHRAAAAPTNQTDSTKGPSHTIYPTLCGRKATSALLLFFRAVFSAAVLTNCGTMRCHDCCPMTAFPCHILCQAATSTYDSCTSALAPDSRSSPSACTQSQV